MRMGSLSRPISRRRLACGALVASDATAVYERCATPARQPRLTHPPQAGWWQGRSAAERGDKTLVIRGFAQQPPAHLDQTVDGIVRQCEGGRQTPGTTAAARTRRPRLRSLEASRITLLDISKARSNVG
jgi:hypothetical protein